MKTVAITGSGRGFGLAMLKEFRKKNFNTVIIDINKDVLKSAEEELESIPGDGKILALSGDITNVDDIKNVLSKILGTFSVIDIWINNAGVNQKMVPLWELDDPTINRLIDVDLKGTVLCSREVVKIISKQERGAIYNVEGLGSHDEHQMGLGIYGTAKRGLSYFTDALRYELGKVDSKIVVGKITPGIMITNFIDHSLGDDEKFELDEKTKKVYNILGDYPETIAKYTVEKIVNNTRKHPNIIWLTKFRAGMRFMFSSFNKRDFFKENKND